MAPKRWAKRVIVESTKKKVVTETVVTLFQSSQEQTQDEAEDVVVEEPTLKTIAVEERTGDEDHTVEVSVGKPNKSPITRSQSKKLEEDQKQSTTAETKQTEQETQNDGVLVETPSNNEEEKDSRTHETEQTDDEPQNDVSMEKKEESTRTSLQKEKEKQSSTLETEPAEEETQNDGVPVEKPKDLMTPSSPETEDEKRSKTLERQQIEETEKSREEKQNRRKRKRRGRGSIEGGEGYRRYVFKVLKQVHPGMMISSKAMTVIDGMMKDMFERISDEAARLSRYSHKMTLSSREIQGAVKLVLPEELGKHAISEGNKAVTNYVSYDIRKT